MTEQQAIKHLNGEINNIFDGGKMAEARAVAVKALQDVQEYHKLGTVEECKESVRFKKYFDELYGQGLEVMNFHKNGDTEPFDAFYEDALECGGNDA